jgi:hypothetical protein
MAGVEEPYVGAYGVLLAFAATNDDLALGRLVGVLADLLHPASPRRGVLRLLLGSGLQARLYAPEFLEGVGASRLNSARLVRHTFSSAAGPGEALRGLAALASAGVLNLHSRRALAELHAGMAGWHVDARIALVGRLASEFESFAQVGLFLRLLLDSPARSGAPGEAGALLRGVMALEDVRDLAGSSRDLMDALPEHAEDIAAGLGAEEAASDADEEGNLAGFVCGDDEVDFSSSEEGEGESQQRRQPAKRPRGASGGGQARKRLKKIR